ncbi:heat shock 70 kDa protein 16-like [Rutidosis leptorrhynchoides]|uniref:heat shock 70 kDa protein 16-like n=1 Tax=Rutidosis leptorrhynchoides TaxID=125765 RepID=UPI003A99F1D1
MSVIGFDVGNESCVIAAAKRGGIDVLLNDESKRETQSVVSFGQKQRFLGSAGAASATANPKTTISQIKRLVGKLYSDPSVQEDLKLLPFVTREGPRGGILIEIDYLKIEKWLFTPVEILGMLFSHLKKITEKNLESPVVDCVIGIPSYFTDLQRREYLDAARIAGLRPLRLLHDGTATALGYGLYKTDFPDSRGGETTTTRTTNVVFVDIGHCDTQVTVAAFEPGKMKILSHSFDENLGGREFDQVLFKHFAEQFKEKHKIDVYSNDRACIRLRAACEKVKKVLSANGEAPISIDCLINDVDVRGMITREEFENLSSNLLERIVEPCNKALNNSGLRVDDISTIELVGSGSRIPIISKILSDYFHKQPTRTLNASECVARGCALHCAMLSPTLQVRDYQIQEYFPYSIGIPVREGEDIILYKKGSRYPKYYKLEFHLKTPFHFQILYTNKTDIPVGTSPKVGEFWIGPSVPSEEKLEGELKLLLNRHGILEIKSASFLDDKRTTLNSYLFLDKMVTRNRMSNLDFSENLYVSTSKDELDEAKEQERMLAEQDLKVEKIKDQRNTLESFVYDTRSKLSGAYRGFATDSEKEVITNRLQQTEEWLYEDEDSDDDEAEQNYTEKLDDLKKLLHPVEKLYKEEKAREQAIKKFQSCIQEYRVTAELMPPRFRKEVKIEINTMEKWLNEISQHRSSIKNDGSVILSTVVKDNMEIFQRRCKAIIEKMPSYSKHDNHRRQPVNSAVCEQSDELNSAQIDESADLDLAADSEQRDQTADSGGQTVESKQRDKIADTDQKGQFVDADQKGQYVDADQNDQSVDADQKDQADDMQVSE